MNAELLVPSVFFVLAVLAGTGLVLFMRFRPKGRDSGADRLAELEMFGASRLQHLQEEGLLSEEEAKRVREIVSERTMEEMRRKAEPQPEPRDMNDLLRDAEMFRREAQSGINAGSAEASSDKESE